MADNFNLAPNIGSVIDPLTRQIVVYHLKDTALAWAHVVGSSEPLQITQALRAEIERDIKKRGISPAPQSFTEILEAKMTRKVLFQVETTYGREAIGDRQSRQEK